MTSYAYVKEITTNHISFEVELVSVEESRETGFAQKPTAFMLTGKDPCLQAMNPGDIFIVSHDGKVIKNVLYRDDYEKQRRTEIVGAIIERLK